MGSNMKLTDEVVKEAEVPEKGRSHIWDDELRGFGLRVYPSGSRSFVFRYTSPTTRRRRLMVLGEYGPMTPHKARKKAERMRGRVLDGMDPQAKKDEAREKARQSVAFREFVPIYLRRMRERWTERTHRDYRSRIDRNLMGPLGSLRLEDITRPLVAELLDRIGEERGPYESNRVHSILRAALNKAEVWGFLPAGHPNPARGIERFKEVARDRWLKPAEVARLMDAVRTLGQGEDEDDAGPYFRAFVPLALLTGMRKGELLGLRWENVDLDRGEVQLPNTKAGRPQRRQLSRPAVEILRFLPREQDNPHVFPGRMSGTHRKDYKREWDAVREKAGLTDCTFHDLRRTAGSHLAQAGVPLQVIQEILGHQSPAITRVYARLSRENERDALEELGEKLSVLMGPLRGRGGG